MIIIHNSRIIINSISNMKYNMNTIGRSFEMNSSNNHLIHNSRIKEVCILIH